MLWHNAIPITLHDKLLTFRDSNKEIELKGEFSKMITNKNYNVDLATLADKKLMYVFAKELYFDLKFRGNKFTSDRTLIKLFKSPVLMISASGSSNTNFLTWDPDELCDRLKLLLEEKQAGNNSDSINEETFAILDNLLEYKCIAKKQHNQNLTECNLLH